MVDTATRVALLARPGMACERLQAALAQAGADVVLIADPTASDVAAVRDAGAQAVLVALDPGVEDVLDRFDAVLGDPSMTVIYDEAELAAKREGWDAARWARHLSAKLQRVDNVLPPGAEPESDFAFGEVPERAEGTRNLHQYRDAAAEATPLPFHAMEHDDNAVLDIDSLGIGDLALEFEALAAATVDGRQSPRDEAGTPELSAVQAFDLPALDMQSAPATQISRIELEPDVADVEIAPATARAVDHRFHRDLQDLDTRIAGLELVDSPRDSTRLTGAVLVLAGIGGPDAVRQLLGELPAEFPRPVLIVQRLDGANHDKLVRQMQRATTMPVHLAETGAMLEPAHVYILPGAIGVTAEDNRLRFAAGADLFASLPAGDSAVIVLSGTDPAIADAAMGLSWGGAFVAGQIPEGCYDATASEAVIARGAENGAPAALAKRLAQRWQA